MNWKKINCEAIINILREMEKQDICLFGEYSIVYSDGKEELKISYKSRGGNNEDRRNNRGSC